MKLIDLIGQRFGRVVVVARAPRLVNTSARWRYRCDCGNEGETGGMNLRQGRTVSCGCFHKEIAGKHLITHGRYLRGANPATLRIWHAMWARVTKPSHEAYEAYGGRGITICERWKDYDNFVADMGERPEGLTLERREVNGNYEPGNCYWADMKVQGNNRRDQSKWLVDGQLLTCAQAAVHWDISRWEAKKRLSTIPVQQGRTPTWAKKPENLELT